MTSRTLYPRRPGGSEGLEFLREMLYQAVHHHSLSDPSLLKVNLTTRDEDKGPRASTGDADEPRS